ncbi:aldehyde dehydrogenase family protein [Pseudomonas sp. BN414]|uniref:aldehyde dehydrogenase family protein n=1 Tax=Pseudomonas sp. BN414 TaxID=2567888 RepID=UPI002456AB80|nr:aldehyde dehydrogenase family protein [Pseudomonas sp. BN414]MDH4565190.1 aldehyde dehydrogenase family protein [Pseudomonas sp. BN414]
MSNHAQADRSRRHYIGGEFVASTSTEAIEVVDPANGERIGEVAAGTSEDINLAVQAARDCFDSRSWRQLSAHDRANTIWTFADRIAAHVDELAELEVRDNGMPLMFAKATVSSLVNGVRYYAGMVTKLHGQTAEISGNGREIHAYTQSEPVGVVGSITPWNAPLGVLINKIAPAIAAGCSIVCKPAEQTPLSAVRLGELLDEWKLFPKGLINIVNGYGHVAGQAMSDHPDIDKLTFTGSTAVGKKLVHASADSNLKRVTLELGGKSPLFIFDDADLDKAITGAAMAIFANSGQVCFAGSRLYIQRNIFDKVIEGVAKVGAAMRLGSGLDPQTQMGPLVSAQQMARVLSYVESGVGEGAELVCGGQRHGDKGFFVTPTVFANRDRKAIRIAEEEIFGPVVTAMPFDGLEELEALANATPYGLGSGIYTSNVGTAHRAAKLIRAGNVWINCYGILDKAMPFGGFKQSGWGRESGFEGIAPFLETKSVYTML